MAVREHTYSVLLVRDDPKAGPVANLRVRVTIPTLSNQTAKRAAESQYHGYRATEAHEVRR